MSEELDVQQATPEGEESEGYRVQLPSFEGPLDLLLHLIRKHKIDIYDIPIVLVTEQYNSYLEAMEQLDLDIAADYIYMAALLIHIKSKMLLPRGEEGEEGEEDPRTELVEKLLEYQRFKAVAESLSEVDGVRQHVWSRPPGPHPEAEPAEVDLSEVSLFDLIDAFRRALVRYKHDHPAPIELTHSAHKVSDKMVELVNELAVRAPIRLHWYLEGRGRSELVAIFLGMLELVRLGGISLAQSEAFGEVLVHRTEKEIDVSEFGIYDH
jgi:segregation and condensation protein A